MQPVAKLDKGPPDGYFALEEVFKVVREEVLKTLSSTVSSWRLGGRESLGDLLEGLSIYLIERLIISGGVLNRTEFKKKISPEIALWHNGSLLHFNQDGNLAHSLIHNKVSIQDFLYTAEYLEDAPRAASKSEAKELLQNCSDLARGKAFIDPITWVIRRIPNINLDSLESYSNFFGILREQWEYEHIQDAWDRVRPYSGAKLVIKGKAPSLISRPLLSELNELLLRRPFPRDKRKRESELRKTAARFLGLNSSEQDAFTLGVLTEWVTGDAENARSHRKAARNFWESFLKELPSEKAEFLRRKGRRPK